MGLDQYAYVASRKGQRAEFYAGCVKFYAGSEFDDKLGEFVNPNVIEPQEIAYWRKHPNLHGWMQKLYEAKGGSGDFNGDELELTWEEIDMLEHDIKKGHLAKLGTTGFFFGKPADYHYKEQDLKFCQDAKAELFLGSKVFYNSSW